MLGYLVTAVLLTLFFTCGIYVIAKHPMALSSIQIRLIAVSLFLFYFFPVLEIVTNGNADYFRRSAVYPGQNIAPLLFLIVLIAGVFTGTKVGEFCFTAISVTIPTILANCVIILIYDILNTKGFYERTALYLFGQIGLILLCISLFRNQKLPIKPDFSFSSAVAISGLYGVIAGYNALTGKNVFGLSLSEKGYFIFPMNRPCADPARTFIVSIAFLVGTAFCTALFMSIIARKQNLKHPIQTTAK